MNSFFSRSHYPSQDLLNLIVFFAQGSKLTQLSFVTGMPVNRTIIDWANSIRDVMKQYVFEEMKEPQMKGIIEVD